MYNNKYMNHQLNLVDELVFVYKCSICKIMLIYNERNNDYASCNIKDFSIERNFSLTCNEVIIKNIIE